MIRTYLIYEKDMLVGEIHGQVAFWTRSVNKLTEEGSREFFEAHGGAEGMLDEHDLIEWLKKEFDLDVEVVG